MEVCVAPQLEPSQKRQDEKAGRREGANTKPKKDVVRPDHDIILLVGGISAPDLARHCFGRAGQVGEIIAIRAKSAIDAPAFGLSRALHKPLTQSKRQDRRAGLSFG
jgi:hypothetical protein